MKKMVKKITIKEAIKEQNVKKEEINLMDIISKKYPETGEDYALQLWYKTYKNVFAKCTEKNLDEDMETAHLVIDNKTYIVNIRNAKIVLL